MKLKNETNSREKFDTKLNETEKIFMGKFEKERRRPGERGKYRRTRNLDNDSH